MRNKGYVTVFLSIMLVVMLIISTAVIHVVDISGAKTKSVTAVRSATSNELANYNRFIFDRYHILLLDSDAGGRGQGALEEEMTELLKENLGEDYQISDVEMSGQVGLMDDDLSEFKKQINDNFIYDAADYGVNEILDKTNGNDKPVSDETLNEVDNDIANEKEEIEKQESEKKKEESAEDDDSQREADEAEKERMRKEAAEAKDPRDELKVYKDAGLAKMLLPEDAELSENIADMSILPSAGKGSETTEAVDTDFKSLDRMKLDTGKNTGWGKNLATEGEALIYARKYFNSLTDQKYQDTYLNLEKEYLVAGKDNDGANFNEVVDEILLIRFAVNFVCIIKDSVKMSECGLLAALLIWFFPPLQPVVKYLLAGCWAYIESIADVYLMVRGHKIPYIKDSTTWVTDMESLSHLDDYLDEPSDEESGLGYDDYLTILMALKGDVLYYRMLDLMQMNASMEGVQGSDTSFRMKNAITVFGVNATVVYKGKEFDIYEEAGYE